MNEVADWVEALMTEIARDTAQLANSDAWWVIANTLAAHGLTKQRQHSLRQQIWMVRRHMRQAADERS